MRDLKQFQLEDFLSRCDVKYYGDRTTYTTKPGMVDFLDPNLYILIDVYYIGVIEAQLKWITVTGDKELGDTFSEHTDEFDIESLMLHMQNISENYS